MSKKPDIIDVKVRMPRAMHRSLMREAKRGGQTLNAEILKRLADAQFLGDSSRLISDTIDEGFKRLMEKLGKEGGSND
jgi:hypothetical protein